MSRSISFRKSHRYDNISNLQTDLNDMDSRDHPDQILELDLNNFGLYNIDRIKEAIKEKKLRMTFEELYMLNRLFDMKAKEKEGDMEGAEKIKKKAIKEYKQDKKDDETAAKITSAVGKSTNLKLSSKTTEKIIDDVLKSDARGTRKKHSKKSRKTRVKGSKRRMKRNKSRRR